MINLAFTGSYNNENFNNDFFRIYTVVNLTYKR